MANPEAGFHFRELAQASKQLGNILDTSELIEPILSRIDAGHSERKAVTMTIIELLQRRGAYHGRLKQAIDDGTIFQMTEHGDHDERDSRKIKRICERLINGSDEDTN